MVNRTKTTVLFFSPVQKLREPVRVRVSPMLQSLSYLMAGGSSSQTSKLRASATTQSQSRKSRFSVTQMAGVQIVRFRVFFLERHHQPMEVMGAAVRVVGTTVQVWEQLPQKVCVVCTYTTSLLAVCWLVYVQVCSSSSQCAFCRQQQGMENSQTRPEDGDMLICALQSRHCSCT